MKIKAGLKAGGGGESSGGPVNPASSPSVLDWLFDLLQSLWSGD
jgi:hypothetical protein